MQFALSTAAAILAFSPAVLAAPSSSNDKGMEYKASATASAPPPPPAATGGLGGLKGLSKTQQIFLSDTRADAINNVLTKDEDFVFNFLGKATGGPGAGGEVIPANRKTFPALTNTGIGMAVVQLKACGFNTPHVHPRATELAVVTEGSVVSSMVPENGVVDADGQPREVLVTLHPFDATVFYQGAVHSQFNPGCGNATFVAALSAEDFGAGQVAQELFATGNAALSAVFGNQVDGAEIDRLRHLISPSVALGVEQCLEKCKIPKRK
jgi:hypothetical protein